MPWPRLEGVNMKKEKTYAISFIIGLTPKIIFRGGTFMFPKEEAENIAEQLRKENPKIEFKVSPMGGG